MNSTDKKVQAYIIRAIEIANASITDFDKIKEYERAMILIELAKMVRTEEVKS